MLCLIDVLLFQVGLMYSDRSQVVDMHAWLHDSAVSFKEHLRTLFDGTVIRIPVTPTYRDWSSDNLYHHEINRILNNVFKIDKPDNWFVIDQWAINYGRSKLYNDRIHYAGK